MAVESVGAVAPARVDEILLGMAAGGAAGSGLQPYLDRREQEEPSCSSSASSLLGQAKCTMP